MSRIRRLGAHAWTVAPWVVQQLRPARPSLHRPFRAEVPDGRWGTVELRGALAGPARAPTLVVLLHGAGGTKDSPYMIRAAAAAELRGAASLRLDLRGADGSGEDVYHAAIVADLAGALASPRLDGYAHVVVAGWSIGGHVALRYALEPDRDPRLRAVAGVSAPLDLAASVRALDSPAGRLYRRHLLSTQKRQLRQVAARRGTPEELDLARALEVRTCAEWDREVVCPRFGFRTADEYYALSAGPRLGELAVPALVVTARHDPMVPVSTIEPALAAHPGHVELRLVERGGHVAFPPALAVEAEVVAWLLDRVPR